MKTIILDTNFIIYILKYKIPLFEEVERIVQENYKIKVLDKSIDELISLENKSKDKLLAKLALKFLRMNEDKIKTIKTDSKETVDNILIELSNKDTIICTQDKELKDALNGPKIIIRQEKYLILT